MSDEDVLKIIILGEGRVGKDSILSKYFDSGQKNRVNPTFYEKTTTYKGKEVKFRFWDTAGQEIYNAISHIYYQNAVGALLIYDITMFETFHKVKNWVKTLKELRGKDITFIIAGNKFDLADKKSLEKNSAEINAYCAKEKCKHIYVSANTGYNLDEAFESLINSVLNKVYSSGESGNPKRRGKRIEISEQKKKDNDKKKCY